MSDHPERKSAFAGSEDRRQQEYDESYRAQRRALDDPGLMASLRERIERLRQRKPVTDRR